MTSDQTQSTFFNWAPGEPDGKRATFLQSPLSYHVVMDLETGLWYPMAEKTVHHMVDVKGRNREGRQAQRAFVGVILACLAAITNKQVIGSNDHNVVKETPCRLGDYSLKYLVM